MATGLYKDNGGWVHVSYNGKFEMPIKRSDYEDRGYKPPYRSLPSKQEYAKANAKGTKRTEAPR